MNKQTDYSEVTEVAGDSVSREQVQRMYTRYRFARSYCDGRDVLELGCGSGQGLGFLQKTARSVVGGDYSASLLRHTQKHYKGRVPFVRLDAHILPFKDQSFDVAILFETVYYLNDAESFVRESMRILRPGGTLLICNPNKDLPDFNPSPYSYRYFSPHDFVRLLRPFGFKVECFGDCKVDYDDPIALLLSFVKKTVVRLNLMPKTMAGKKLLKRIIFGKLVSLPPELTEENPTGERPCVIESSRTDRCHKVIFAVGQKAR